MAAKGVLFILFGPSGVGKTTLAEAVIARFPHNLTMVPSYTTRLARGNEQHGVSYWFISPEEFKKKIKEHFFLEYSTAYKAAYGSSYKEVMDLLNKGHSVLMVIDRQGVEQVLQRIGQAIPIQIIPPRMDILIERLHKRGDISSQETEFRMKQAEKEMEAESAHHLASYVVVNDDLESAIDKICKIIQEHILPQYEHEKNILIKKLKKN